MLRRRGENNEAPPLLFCMVGLSLSVASFPLAYALDDDVQQQCECACVRVGTASKAWSRSLWGGGTESGHKRKERRHKRSSAAASLHSHTRRSTHSSSSMEFAFLGGEWRGEIVLLGCNGGARRQGNKGRGGVFHPLHRCQGGSVAREDSGLAPGHRLSQRQCARVCAPQEERRWCHQRLSPSSLSISLPC